MLQFYNCQIFNPPEIAPFAITILICDTNV